jgi:hypothetical protein
MREKDQESKYHSGRRRFAPRVFLFHFCDVAEVVFKSNLVTRGVSHWGLAICIKKYLKAKEEIWKLKYFTMQKYNLQKML